MAVVCVASIAALIAIYMGLYQWGLIDGVWDPVFGDQTHQVLNSNVSHQLRKGFRIPDSIMGAIAYLGDVFFALAGSTRRWQDRPWLVILFGISVIPVGLVSAILICLQGTVVGAWCFLCQITALISMILIFFAYSEVVFCLRYLIRVWKMGRSKRLLWNTFWGTASQVAMEAGEQVLREK
jgi:uncharacterized membrane protein